MPAAFTSIAFAPPSAPSPPPVPAPETPPLGGFSRLSRLVTQGLSGTWVPLCPALTNELDRGAGRRE